MSPDAIAPLGDDLWIANAGALFKMNADTGLSVLGFPFPRPLIPNLGYSGAIAVAGDDLYVANQHDGIVSKYNATTGELINDRFVPPLDDQLGGIAVAPQSASGDHALADLEFESRARFSNFAMVMLMDGNYIFLIVGMMIAFIIVGVLWLIFRRRTPSVVPTTAALAYKETPPSPATTPSALPPTPEAVPPLPVPEEPAPPMPPGPGETIPPAPASGSMSGMKIVVITIIVVTLLVTLFLSFFAIEWVLAANATSSGH
jgi:DNA-binding beta-propeller fold protein YncE